MLRLVPETPPAPVQLSCNAQPICSETIRLRPTNLPLASRTSQSPCQKSNWRYFEAAQAGGFAFGAPCATAMGIVHIARTQKQQERVNRDFMLEERPRDPSPR